jgi:hypothetical protein
MNNFLIFSDKSKKIDTIAFMYYNVVYEDLYEQAKNIHKLAGDRSKRMHQ